jgi:glycosyltransferase involved in cell wall biosynthesis
MRILYIRNINQVAQIHGRELVQRNHFVKIYEPNLAGGLAPLPMKLMRMPERVFDLRHIVGELNAKHFDLIHIHWASYGVLGLASRAPFVLECHGTDVRNRLRHPFFRALLAPVFHRAAAILCITPDLLPVVRALRSDALFFPGPVNVQQFKPAEELVRYPAHPWIILLFARLCPEKGSTTALEGIARFTQRHKGIRVRLLDWGPLSNEYKQRYGKRFEFVPLMPPEQVQLLIQSADVVVGQFSLGALGLSELQAMSCAKPVICSFLHQDAYPIPPPLCQASTPEEVDNHLERLFQQPDVGAMLGRKAREWICSYHSPVVLSNKLEAIYNSILEQKTLITPVL